MANLLLVPMHLDALYLQQDKTLVAPTADFTRLPYKDSTRLHHSSVPNISEAIASQPLQAAGWHAKAGIHLHWALPDALTHAVHDANHDDTTDDFPRVPNRWLITRIQRDGAGNEIKRVTKRWVIESDYLSAEDASVSEQAGVSYPHAGSGKPYRHLGRKLHIQHWEEGSGFESLPKLTAIGYGEPSFAAFYPNCHSVFGFYDPEYISHAPVNVEYVVLGWYSDASTDHLRHLVNQSGMTVTSLLEQLKWDVNVTSIDIAKAAFKIKLSSLDNTLVPETDGNAIWTELRDKNWIVEQVVDTSATLVAVADRHELSASYTDNVAVIEQALCAQFPNNILCYSRITFKPENDTT
ncbi:MAG: hypothetical protein JKY13_00325, partial [Gammaproteobacteria bacterium]|nr:hypothetical protein [Gammaproteobacteria bacterium]